MTHRRSYGLAVSVLLGIIALSARAGLDPNIPVNVIVNGDFESGANWAGTKVAPEGWTNLDQPNSSLYLDGSVGPLSGSRSLFTEGDGGTRGQITAQTGLSMDDHWKMRFDFASQDPPIIATRDHLSLYLTIYTNEAENHGLTLWFRDDNPDDGTLDIYVRDPGLTYIGSVPGFAFSSDIVNAPISHQIIIEGHNDLAAPTFDLTIKNASGTDLAYFPGLTNWRGDNDPSQGESPETMWFAGDAFSTGRAKIDNVEMGSWAAVRGDFNADNVVNVADIDLLCEQIRGNQNPPTFDLNGDTLVNGDDLTVEVEDIIGTELGDSDLDDDVDLSDLGNLATNYEQSPPRTWGQGDFDCDEDVDLSDLGTLATNYSGGQASAYAEFSALTGVEVPEPTGVGLLALAGAILFARRDVCRVV